MDCNLVYLSERFISDLNSVVNQRKSLSFTFSLSLLILLTLLSPSNDAKAQVALKRSSIATSGGVSSVRNSRKIVLYTAIGQSSPVSIHDQSNLKITQGYLQPMFLPTSAENFTLDFELFPNPTSQYMKLEFDEIQENTKLEIYNSEGRRTFSSPLNEDKQFILDLIFLPSGIYHLSLLKEGKIIGKKKLMKL